MEDDVSDTEVRILCGSFENLTSVKWDSRFKERQKFIRKNENEPYINTLKHEDGEEGGVSLARTFMQGPDTNNICVPQADKVSRFCSGASLDGLQDSKAPHLVALLDERSINGGTIRCRDTRGPWTARGLYDKLRAPVREPSLLW
jgi:hypothetical protein